MVALNDLDYILVLQQTVLQYVCFIGYTKYIDFE